MRVQEWINNNSMTAILVAVVLLVIAATVVVLQLRESDSRPTAVYFWDLGTEQSFVLASDETPPVEAPSGERGVRAHLFTCGACTPDEWFGYLQVPMESAGQDGTGQDVPGEQQGYLVRALDGNQWVPYTSEEGMEIQDRAYGNSCNGAGAMPQQCLPDGEG